MGYLQADTVERPLSVSSVPAAGGFKDTLVVDLIALKKNCHLCFEIKFKIKKVILMKIKTLYSRTRRFLGTVFLSDGRFTTSSTVGVSWLRHLY